MSGGDSIVGELGGVGGHVRTMRKRCCARQRGTSPAHSVARSAQPGSPDNSPIPTPAHPSMPIFAPFTSSPHPRCPSPTLATLMSSTARVRHWAMRGSASALPESSRVAFISRLRWAILLVRSAIRTPHRPEPALSSGVGSWPFMGLRGRGSCVGQDVAAPLTFWDRCAGRSRSMCRRDCLSRSAGDRLQDRSTPSPSGVLCLRNR